MPCDCDQCHRHCQMLGLAAGAPSKEAIRKAYRGTAKLWHPDMFEKHPHLRAEAEEHFKQVQVAYQELSKHNAAPVVLPPQSDFVRPVARAAPPSISFGGAPGCLVSPHFTSQVEEIVLGCVGSLETVLAIVDLAGSGPDNSGFSQFFLMASHGIMVRDHRSIVSLLWYADLGEIKLIDRRRSGRLGAWHRLVGGILGLRPSYSLQIYRRNGSRFYSLSDPVDDEVKTVIYRFLMRQKSQTQP